MMDTLRATFFSTCVVVLFGGSYSQECSADLSGKSAAFRLSNDLFCSYYRNVRPVLNQTTQTNVSIKFFINNVHMDDRWQVLSLSVQLLMTWKDEFLVWNSSNYGDISGIHQDSSTIWIPDITSFVVGLHGADTKDHSYSLPASIVKISNNGMVKYYHRITLNAQCLTNIEKWPFDSHNCSVLIGSPLYKNNLLNYNFLRGPDDLIHYNPNREWMVNSVYNECIYLYYYKSHLIHCIIQYTIHLQRFSSTYYSTIIIPAIVISLMGTFTFLMGRETSRRITLLSILFISQLLYIQFLDMKIPNNGDHLVYIILLFRNSLILTTLEIVMSVISNEIYKRGTENLPPNSPEWIKTVVQFLTKKRTVTMPTCFNSEGSELLIENHIEDNTPVNQRNENALFWKTLSVLLDRLVFIITFALSIINFFLLKP